MTDAQSSTKEAAADEAKQTASVATDRGKQVAGTAGEQAQQVVGAARDQASQVATQATEQISKVVDDAKSHLRGQAEGQTGQAGKALANLAQQFGALVDGRPDDAGPVADLARQAADKLGGVADQINDRGFDGVAADVQQFARRRPVVFLAGAVGAGFLVGRLIHAHRDSAADEGVADETGSAALPAGTGYQSALPTSADVPWVEEDAWLPADATGPSVVAEPVGDTPDVVFDTDVAEVPR